MLHPFQRGTPDVHRTNFCKSQFQGLLDQNAYGHSIKSLIKQIKQFCNSNICAADVLLVDSLNKQTIFLHRVILCTA